MWQGGIFIDSKRLKLYNTRVTIRLNNKDKKRLRKYAYKEECTMSEYCRNLIKLSLLLKELDVLKQDQSKKEEELDKLINKFGSLL